MKKTAKKSVKKAPKAEVASKKPSRKKSAAKVAGVVGAVGLGAVIYKNRERVRQLAMKLFAKVNQKFKKTA